jgi:DNA-binding response OmpR family regulator
MSTPFPFLRARALVLEADEQEAGALIAALSNAGFMTDHAARPNTANALLQVADQEGLPYEVLVVSTMVSGICGLDLAAALSLRVRTRPATLLCSGPYSAPEPGLLARVRCSGVILKPLREDQFLAVLTTALSAERLRVIGAERQSGLVAL